MTTNLHYLIAGMAVLLVVLWQYSHQRQMDDRNSLMFRRLLTVISSGRFHRAGEYMLHPVRSVQLRHRPHGLEHRVLSVPGDSAAHAAVLCLYTVLEPRDLHRNRTAHGHSDYRSGFYHSDQPLHRKAVLFRQHRLLPRSCICCCMSAPCCTSRRQRFLFAVHRDAVSRRNLMALLAVFLLAALGIAAQASIPRC